MTQRSKNVFWFWAAFCGLRNNFVSVALCSTVCSAVPCSVGGLAKSVKFTDRTSFVASAKSHWLSIPSISTRTEQLTIYSIFNIKKKEES